MPTLLRVALMTLLWTSAVMLMLIRTATRDQPDLAFLTGWALLFGMAGMVVTGYHLLLSERSHCTAIAESAAASALAHQDKLRSVE